MKQTHGLNVPEKLEELCHPRTMALLIYDMQVGIRSQIKGGDEIVARVRRALTAARKAGMRVVYTRHVSMPKSWMGVTQYRTAMAWQRKEEPDAVTPWFLRDAPPWESYPWCSPMPAALAIRRPGSGRSQACDSSARPSSVRSTRFAGCSTAQGSAPLCSLR